MIGLQWKTVCILLFYPTLSNMFFMFGIQWTPKETQHEAFAGKIEVFLGPFALAIGY